MHRRSDVGTARCVEQHLSHKLLSWMLHIWVVHICGEQQDALGSAVARMGFWWEGDICTYLTRVAVTFFSPALNNSITNEEIITKPYSTRQSNDVTCKSIQLIV